MNAITETKAGHTSIAAALAAAQSEMGRAIKDSNNPHFRSKYADLGSVMDACLPALNRHGISVIQPAGEDEHGRFVATMLLHTSGEKLECKVPLIVQKNDMQGYGSAVTYARRYGLMCMAGIAPDDDDGNAAAKAAPPKQEPRPNRTPSGQPAPADQAAASLRNASTLEQLAAIWQDLPRSVQILPEVIGAKDQRKAALQANPPITDDEIPY